MQVCLIPHFLRDNCSQVSNVIEREYNKIRGTGVAILWRDHLTDLATFQSLLEDYLKAPNPFIQSKLSNFNPPNSLKLLVNATSQLREILRSNGFQLENVEEIKISIIGNWLRFYQEGIHPTDFKGQLMKLKQIVLIYLCKSISFLNPSWFLLGFITL